MLRSVVDLMGGDVVKKRCQIRNNLCKSHGDERMRSDIEGLMDLFTKYMNTAIEAQSANSTEST